VLAAVPLCALLAIVTVTDLDRRVVPNRALAIGAVAAIAAAALGDPPGLGERLAAAALGGGCLLPIALARPEGLGIGDVKLVAVIGLFLGAATAVAVIVAFAAGALAGAVLLIRDGAVARTRSIPFAPFLAGGGVVGLGTGGPVVHWYVTSMFGG
jgi:prepilin signal peptidase PulO-like enzyme (type II secretory pathway)